MAKKTKRKPRFWRAVTADEIKQMKTKPGIEFRALHQSKRKSAVIEAISRGHAVVRFRNGIKALIAIEDIQVDDKS